MDNLRAKLKIDFSSVGAYLATLLAFAIPVSTALTTVSMILILLLWLFSPNIKPRITLYFQNPLTPYIGALVGVVFIGMTYSPAAPADIFDVCKDAVRLSFIPLLMYYLQDDKHRLWVGKAFVCAMVLTMVLGYCKVYGGLPIGEKYTVGAVFKSHIKTSYFMALAAFFTVLYGIQHPKQRWWLGILVVLMMHYLFFLSVGRIGHLTLFVLSLVFAWRRWKFKGFVCAGIALCLLFALAYQSSSVFSDRINLLKRDWVLYQEGGRLIESSLGSRIEFADSSMRIFATSPVVGIGTGAYAHGYETLHKDETILMTVNPHNEYLRFMVETGCIGLIVLLALFFKQWQLTRQLPPNQRLLAQGCLVSFYVGCLLNSWLADFTEAYFYCLFSAVLFSKLGREFVSEPAPVELEQAL
tara:strand:+ start:9310 stop:10545 length:1236 start_codon:yes stop_codon:yes gene_type:complete